MLQAFRSVLRVAENPRIMSAGSDDSASLISEEYQDSEYDYANSDPDLPTGSGNSSRAHFVDDAPDSRASSLYTIITPANLAAHQVVPSSILCGLHQLRLPVSAKLH